MDDHIRTLRKEELLFKHDGWFDDENAERVMSWLVAAENLRPVVLIGAGFTLNGRDRVTGKPATRKQAPLWADIAKRLADDLGVGKDRYDAPTLFEMYQEALGNAKLRDALRATVDDSALVPGDAHDALAIYPCEAIVTTNCLDSLLDRACGPGWRRVVGDADLSASSTSGQDRDLIYLHGHRDSSDSWVMTRSQYEDFHRSRPVMVARVRQLLAQHPWLIVGFGMTDPNFHAITRLLGAEMRGHQPLSLVLMTGCPLLAERQHWRRLGFEIATPNLDRDTPRRREFGDFLAWAFPKLGTRYSPTSEIAKAYIKRGGTPEERLRRFRLANSAASMDGDAGFRDWEEQLANILTSDERKRAEDTAEGTLRRAISSTTKRPKDGRAQTASTAVEEFPETQLSPLLLKLEREPRELPSGSNSLIRRLDVILAKGQQVRSELAEHFAWGLERKLFPPGPPRLDVLAIRLAKDVGWDGGRIQRLLQHAVAAARTNDDNNAEQRLLREAADLGIELPPEETARVEPHLLQAQEAHRAYLDASFEAAADLYARAARTAATRGLDLEVWAYTNGQAWALARLDQPSLGRPSATESEDEHRARRLRAEDLQDQVKRLAERPAVERWLQAADGRLRGVLQEVLEANRERERFRRTGGDGMRWNNRVYDLWRSCRELREMFAPPPLLKQYLAPLESSLDASDALLAIVYAAKPREWLSDLLGEGSTLREREERDELLVETFFTDVDRLTRTELVARIECAGSLGSVLRVQDIPRALGWLKAAWLRVGGGWVTTAWGNSSLDEAYWTALSALARWATPSATLEAARGLLADDSRPRSLDGAAQALYGLPWRGWRLESGDTAEGFVELLSRLAPDAEPAESVSSWHHRASTTYAFFALLGMLEAGLEPLVLGPGAKRWKAALGATALAHDAPSYARASRAGFLLERRLGAAVGELAKGDADLFAEWWPSETQATMFERDEIWTTLADLVASRDDALLPRVQRELDELIRSEGAIKHYTLNPHLAYPAMALVVNGMQFLEDERPRIAGFALELLDASPAMLEHIAPVLRSDWWGADEWDRLVTRLVSASAGAGPRKGGAEGAGLSTRRQLAVLGLVGELERNEGSLHTTDPGAWNCLQGLALAAIEDERLLVANHAAFAVAKLAMNVEDSREAVLYVGCLQRIAEDPRVPVRSAVADGGPGLAERAKHERIREAARAAVEAVERDVNAQVRGLVERARIRMG